jgi:hypothetical protein
LLLKIVIGINFPDDLFGFFDAAIISGLWRYVFVISSSIGMCWFKAAIYKENSIGKTLLSTKQLQGFHSLYYKTRYPLSRIRRIWSEEDKWGNKVPGNALWTRNVKKKHNRGFTIL